MPLLGDKLRFAEQKPLSAEELAQHAVIDASLQDLSIRMCELAPTARERRWYHNDGLKSVGKRALYTPGDNPTTQMAAWLEVIHWRRGAGPSSDKAHSSVEVNLKTQAKVLTGSLAGKEGRPIRRASVFSGKLAVYLSPLMRLNLKGIDYESATNILTDLSDTLDVIEEAGVLESNPTAGRLISVEYPSLQGDRKLEP